jgi:hypothetical protein
MKALHAAELWMPVLGELTWVPYVSKHKLERTAPAQRPQTLAEYNAGRMREDLDALTETFVELYLEANPKMAQRLGHA